MAMIKRGMGGSNGGRGRREPTAILKADSSKARRAEGVAAVAEQPYSFDPNDPALFAPLDWEVLDIMAEDD